MKTSTKNRLRKGFNKFFNESHKSNRSIKVSQKAAILFKAKEMLKILRLMAKHPDEMAVFGKICFCLQTSGQ